MNKENMADMVADLEFIEKTLNDQIRYAKDNFLPFGELTLAKFRVQKLIVNTVKPGAIYLGPSYKPKTAGVTDNDKT